jgi:hypothetical protein
METIGQSLALSLQSGWLGWGAGVRRAPGGRRSEAIS